jgi:hypothetical protein
MNDETGEPVSVEATVLGVAFAIAIGVGGVWLAVQRSDQFSAGDAFVPVIVGGLVGFAIAGAALALYFTGQCQPARAGTRWLSVPAAAGGGLLLLSGPPALQAGAAAGLSACLLPLVIVGGAVSRRHRQSNKRPQEPETPSGT